MLSLVPASLWTFPLAPLVRFTANFFLLPELHLPRPPSLDPPTESELQLWPVSLSSCFELLALLVEGMQALLRSPPTLLRLRLFLWGLRTLSRRPTGVNIAVRRQVILSLHIVAALVRPGHSCFFG